MEDTEKPKQLINELAELRQRIAELEKPEKGSKRADEALQKAHDELEIRAQERTAELVKANVTLWAAPMKSSPVSLYLSMASLCDIFL